MVVDNIEIEIMVWMVPHFLILAVAVRKARHNTIIRYRTQLQPIINRSALEDRSSHRQHHCYRQCSDPA